MGMYIENRTVPCIYCGFPGVPGQEYKTETKTETITECKWTCPRCCRLVRCDEKREKKQQIQPKTEVKKDEKKV